MEGKKWQVQFRSIGKARICDEFAPVALAAAKVSRSGLLGSSPPARMAGRIRPLFLAAEHRVVRNDFLTIYVLGRDVPDLVGWSAVGELFGFGLGAVTGAAIVWILKKPKGALNGESS